MHGGGLLLWGAALTAALPPPSVSAAGTADCVVQFEFDSVELTPRARAALDAGPRRTASAQACPAHAASRASSSSVP